MTLRDALTSRGLTSPSRNAILSGIRLTDISTESSAMVRKIKPILGQSREERRESERWGARPVIFAGRTRLDFNPDRIFASFIIVVVPEGPTYQNTPAPAATDRAIDDRNPPDRRHSYRSIGTKPVFLRCQPRKRSS